MSIWNGKYKSIKHIIEKAYRDTGSIFKIDYYDAIEWAGECIEFIGTPMQLRDEHDCITITDFKGRLPCDLHLLLGVRENTCKHIMRYSTDSFHHTLVCKNINKDCCITDLTYTINDDFIFTSFETGKIEIVYKALPTDEEGYPLIPDMISYVMAIKYYIEERIMYKGVLTGKVQQYIYEKALQDRNWYIAAAHSKGNMPSVDMMESIKNSWIRLIPKINSHADGFKSTGEQEQRYTHNSRYSSLTGRDPHNTTYTYTG